MTLIVYHRIIVNIFEYTDFRQFLSDYFKQNKARKCSFTHRRFAKEAGFASPSYLNMIIKGERNLTTETIQQCAKALNLNKRETHYFEAMVFFNQSTDPKNKDFYFEKMVFQRPKRFRTVDETLFEYFTHHYYVAIREMLALPDFQENVDWIIQRLRYKITPSEVTQAIEILTKLRLFSRDESGKLIRNKAVLKTTPDEKSHEIFNYHRSILQEAKDAIMNVSVKNREVIALTIPMCEETVPEVKAILQKCQDDIAALINNGSANFGDVYQVNMQLYPVTQKIKT